MIKVIVGFFVFSVAQFAMALPQTIHVFECAILDRSQSPQKKVYLEVYPAQADENLVEGVGKFVVYEALDNSDSPYWRALSSATNARFQLVWERPAHSQRLAIVSAKIDLGRSGHIEMGTSERYVESLTVAGWVQGAAPGIQVGHRAAARCTYALGGPRPGTIGSN